MALFFLESGGVVGEYVLQKFKGIFAAHGKTAHMRNIKKPRVPARDQVFFNDAGFVMQRHFPAGKFYHVSAQLDVAIIQGGFVQIPHWSSSFLEEV